MVKEKSFKIQNIPESVWVDVERAGYNRDAILSAFDKYDRNLGGQFFDTDLMERILWKRDICNFAGETDLLDLNISSDGEIDFKKNYLLCGFKYDPKNSDEFTVWRDYSESEEEKDDVEEPWYASDIKNDETVDGCEFDMLEADGEFDDVDVDFSSSELLDFEELLSFGIFILALTLEELFGEDDLYGSYACLEKAKEVASQGKTLAELVAELRHVGFCEKDIFKTVVIVMGNLK